MYADTVIDRPARRIRAISRAEMKLLWRNKTAVFTALAIPAGMVLLLAGSGVQDAVGVDLGEFAVTALATFTILFVVYYNLVTAYVARREELVLKRLRASEATDREILLGTAAPAIALAVAQIVVAVVATAALFDLGLPVNPTLIVLAIAGGTAVFVLLAAASTTFTRNVELAQVTTLPVLAVTLMFSGLLFPLDVLPAAGEQAARLLPLTPVVELLNLGLTGTAGAAGPVGFAGTFSEAVVPVAVLVVWLVIGWDAVRRWFRWEPRA